MITCRELVKTVTLDQHAGWGLKLKQWMQVKLHILFCVHCRRYLRHLQIMKASFKQLFTYGKEANDPKDLEQLQKKILQKLI